MLLMKVKCTVVKIGWNTKLTDFEVMVKFQALATKRRTYQSFDNYSRKTKYPKEDFFRFLYSGFN